EISVVVSTHNRIKLLENCLNSLSNQTCDKEKYEIIVADDNSNDGTQQWVKTLHTECNLRYLRLDVNSSCGIARNYGVKHSKGEIIGFIDDDATVKRDWIEKIVKFYKERPDIAACGNISRNIFCKFNRNYECLEYIIESKENSVPNNTNVIIGELDISSFMVGNNSSVRKDIFLRLGGFDESLRTCEDIDFGHKVIRNGYKICSNPEMKATHYLDINPIRICIKYYKYGLEEVIIMKRYYKNNIVIHFSLIGKIVLQFK
ncbi:unnamed protein product, partial [marine sediment metagenome]